MNQPRRATSIQDETWIPLKWIYTLVGSAAVSLVTIISGIWYVATLASHAEVAHAEIESLTKRADLQEVDRKEVLLYMRTIDGRLSRIEGILSAPSKSR